MCNNNFTKEIEISNYDDLVKVIQGKSSKCKDLRNDFIFRGVENSNFQLIPSALRGDNINSFVDEDFKIAVRLNVSDSKEYGLISEDADIPEGNSINFTLNKYGKFIPEKCNDIVDSFEEFQFRKELNALLNFLDNADRSGLKIPIKQETRDFIEHDVGKKFNESHWPSPLFYEVISLAQHYGIPTRALDWSYDYKVALYFAVKNILSNDYDCCEKPDNGVIWAFNYKFFQIHPIFEQGWVFPIQYYRPEYASNPNLNAQKGLFTFIIDNLDYISRQPFDKFIEDNLLGKLNDFEGFNGMGKLYIPNGEKAFYKFIIPESVKPEILDELYHEGYSEEYLFPGYDGVKQAVENRIKLDKLLKGKTEI